MYYVYLFPWKFHILSADRLSVRTRLTLIPTPPPPTPTRLLLSPFPSPHMPTISPHSIPPSLHPTRDYWFTHNLLFNIREQTFQNLCNLSISMCLSYGFVCASAESGCVCCCSFWLHPDAASVRSLWRERAASLKKRRCIECPSQINENILTDLL